MGNEREANCMSQLLVALSAKGSKQGEVGAFGFFLKESESIKLELCLFAAKYLSLEYVHIRYDNNNNKRGE